MEERSAINKPLVRLDVEFKTLDNLTLRGWLYPVKDLGPGIILTPGYNCIKEMQVQEVAEEFQNSGVTALVYDNRSIGGSDGKPRNEVDPGKNIEDYSDALTYMRTVENVDSSRIALWGISMSGSVALCAGALDKRAKLVIAFCPMSLIDVNEKLVAQVLSRTIKDRESQMKGNAPMMLPMSPKRNPLLASLGFGFESDKEAIHHISEIGSRLSKNFSDVTTLQSYYQIVKWIGQAKELIQLTSPTPVMLVIPENDVISPAEGQFQIFEALKEPKRLHLVSDRGHINALGSGSFPKVMKAQVDYMKEVFGEF